MREKTQLEHMKAYALQNQDAITSRMLGDTVAGQCDVAIEEQNKTLAELDKVTKQRDAAFEFIRMLAKVLKEYLSKDVQGNDTFLWFYRVDFLQAACLTFLNIIGGAGHND